MLKPNPNADVPQAFLDIFRQLARRTQVPRMFEPAAARDYYALLQDYPMHVLAASAEAYARRHVFFPAVSEWISVITMMRVDDWINHGTVPVCSICQNRGLLVVRYSSGDPFDLAICDCHDGDAYRRIGSAFIRSRFNLAPEHRIADLEAFSGDDQ